MDQLCTCTTTQCANAHAKRAARSIEALHLFHERLHLQCMTLIVRHVPALDGRDPGPFAIAIAGPEVPGHLCGAALSLSDDACTARRNLVFATVIHSCHHVDICRITF